tara:strand:+ start:51 stop:470 length:420 start_codon:yes stop_codon:yes gene_type:complete
VAQAKFWGNLNRGCISYSDKRANGTDKVHYLEGSHVVELAKCEFRVAPAGHLRAVKVREVVARIHAEAWVVMPNAHYCLADYESDPNWIEVSYNPKERPSQDHFATRSGERVATAERAVIITDPSINNKAKVKAFIRTN